jgi:Mn-dependent DtxR family transcriptional regulator
MMGDWTFFSNYGHVLVCLARNREVRLRDVAVEVGITERAVQKIVRDLQDADYLIVTKQGRCNRYRINRRKTLRHGLESHCTVSKLLSLTAKPRRVTSAVAAGPETVELAETKLRAASIGEQPAKAPEKISKPKEEDKEATPLETKQQGSLF